jgi:putative FmdB family regulatory protein
MPTYDYICTACGNSWELEQRIVEDAVKKCPKCGKNKAKRQISSGAGFILKGGGWYADGYGSKKASSSESKSDEKAAKADSKSEKTTEQSSEKKSEPAKPDNSTKAETAQSGGGSSGDAKKSKDAKASSS